MSSTAAASSSLCMVALGRPKSTTGQSAIRKRPSEVPPWVESSGVCAGLRLDRRADDVVDRPGGVRKASPEIFASTVAPGAAASAVRRTSATRSSPRWRLLKRMLSWARAAAGDDVGRLARRLDRGDLEVGRLERRRCRRRAGAPRARRSPAPASAPDCRRGAGRRHGPARRAPSTHMLTEPRRPILTMSPSRASEVGSPIRIMSGRMPRSAIQSDQLGVP